MAKNISVTFKASNIGPHKNLDCSLNFSSLKVGVFANNGSGKTFLSRMFRLVENSEVEHTNKVLSLNKSTGDFSFQIDENKETGGTSEKLKIKISKDEKPQIENNTKYIYHVFNSDYVKENIEEMKFLPDGEIEGYILGKAKIDLSKEKAKLKILEKNISEKETAFINTFKKAKEELDILKISKNTHEYKFTDTNIYESSLNYTDDSSFDDLKTLNEVLSRMPNDLLDVEKFEITTDVTFLSDLTELLKTKHSKSSFAKEFKEKIDLKHDFVADGLTKLPKDRNDWKNCPFCEQELIEASKNLINNYTIFLNDEESKIKTEINEFITKLDKVSKGLITYSAKHTKISKAFENVKQYIPSEANVILEYFEDDNKIKDPISALKVLLEGKKIDIEKIIDVKEFENYVQLISSHIESTDKTVEDNNNLITSLNVKRKNTSSEKLNLNRRLCKALYQKLQVDLEKPINERKELDKQKKELDEDIKKKESQEKVSKKDEVIKSLEHYLNCFFGDKYTLDKENFCLKFDAHLMSNNATDILSDGEKSIVAFCFYLSDVHKVVSKETDYENLFFIIDDPVSSLDFHYVYSVSQVLRNLKDRLNVQRNRFLIFTHNLEFMSILIRNKIIGEHIILTNGRLIPLSRELVMPYEEHLRDVNMVSKGDKPPSHTTPNSVRHVLETINQFEKPNKDLKGYVKGQNILEGNEFVYSLIHDGSHGVIRKQKPYTNDMIKKGCEVVIGFVKQKFVGQIEQIEDNEKRNSNKMP